MISIGFIANKYPNIIDRNGLVFVQQLVWALSDLDVECTVICPLAVNLNVKFLKVPYHIEEISENGKHINVYFPKFFGLGQSHYVFGKSPVSITTYFFTKSVLKTIKKNKIKIDAVYGHFVAPAGVSAARVGRELSIPSFVAHGESSTWSIDQFGSNNTKKEFNTLAGVIAVSSRNKSLIIDKNVIGEDKIAIFPNGYNPKRFYKISKLEARKKMGWDEDKFIVGMVGSLIDRKGPLRLQSAVDKTKEVFFACAGKGDQIPNSKRCLFAKPVNNENLVYFYNALDAFVLPTQNEGCCNAIVEAIACGCPIISSDLSFNYEICDKTNSILVDPNDINQIYLAIMKLYSDEKLLKQLSDGSIKKAKELTLDNRAKNILSFIKENGNIHS